MKIARYLVIFLFPVLFNCDTDPGLEPTQSGFKGTILFRNEWPENTDQVIVVASTKFPPTNITEIVLGEPLPLNIDSVDYEIYTPPEKFAAIGVVWKEKDQPWDVTNIIGIYFDSENHFSPGIVEIKNRQQMVDSVDIIADLSKAKRKVDSKITGTLFATGTWPTTAQSALVAVSKVVIPTSLLDISFGVPISVPFDSVKYSIAVQPGTYRLIGALIIENGVPIGVSSIKGIYKKKPTDFLPGSVVVPSDTSIVENVNINIDFENSPF